MLTYNNDAENTYLHNDVIIGVYAVYNVYTGYCVSCYANIFLV